MADLIEHLRRQASQQDMLTCEDMLQAADEIERLRHIVDVTTAQKTFVELKSLRAENERLRAAMERIVALEAALQDLVDRWSTERGFDGAIQRARALLMEAALRYPKEADVRTAVTSKHGEAASAHNPTERE